MKAPFTFLALALATSVGGCASLTGATASSCDGSARRPLNRSLWDWESAKPIAVAPIEAPAPAPAPIPSVSSDARTIRNGEIGERAARDVAARVPPVFDIAASLHPCDGADHG